MTEGSPIDATGAPCSGSLQTRLDVRDRVLAAAFALGQAAAMETDFERMCDLAVEQVVRVFEPDTAALLFADPRDGTLYVKRAVGEGAEALADRRWRPGEGVAGISFDEQRLVFQQPTADGGSGAGASSAARSCDPGDDPLADQSAVLSVPLSNTPATAAVPLVADRQVKGVLAVGWGDAGRCPCDENLHLFEVLAAQAAAALDNAWLHDQLKRFNAKLEAQVERRTAQLDARNAELARTTEELKQTQLQVIQAERLASLGQLTAGVAHEINNPLAYTISNLTTVQRRRDDLRLRVDLATARERLARADDAAGRLAAASAFVEALAATPRYRDDVVALREDLADLEPAAAAALAGEFLDYVRQRETRERGSTEALSASLERLIDRALVGLERVKRIVLDLKSFSHLDEAPFQVADVDAGIASTFAMLGHLAEERGVQLEHVAGLTAPLACYPAKLNQVVMNLVENALQATPRGGRVTVTTGEADGAARIVVHDTGAGIAADVLPHIFEPLFTTKPAGQGTGLGLGISHQIIEEHQGRIDVVSEPGSGTTFTVHIPRRDHPRDSARRGTKP